MGDASLLASVLMWKREVSISAGKGTGPRPLESSVSSSYWLGWQWDPLQDRSGLALLFLKENAELLQDRREFTKWNGGKYFIYLRMKQLSLGVVVGFECMSLTLPLSHLRSICCPLNDLLRIPLCERTL